jgi:hypothetical protein
MKDLLNKKLYDIVLFFMISMLLNATISASIFKDNINNFSNKETIVPLGLGDILFEYDVETPTGYQCYGIDFDGDYFWITGTSDPDVPKLFKFDIEGNLIDTYDQPEHCWCGTAWQYMAFDGEYLYSISTDEYMEHYLDRINPVTGQWIGHYLHFYDYFHKGLTYDSATDHFWTAKWLEGWKIFELDRNGTIVGDILYGIPYDIDLCGLAWDNVSEDGPWLWIYDKDNTIRQFNPRDGSLTGLTYTGLSYGSALGGGACFIDDWNGTGVFVGLSRTTPDTIFGMDVSTPLPSEYNHDISVEEINMSSTGPYTFNPEVMIKNCGNISENNIPINVHINSRELLSGLDQDFEENCGNFSHSLGPGPGFNDDWEWGVPSTVGPDFTYSGISCWGTNVDGYYQPDGNGILDSESVQLSNMSNASLIFHHWYKSHKDASSPTAYSGLNVKISNDNGDTWTIIHPDNGYPCIAHSGNRGIPGEPCFGGFSDGWETISFDISSYINETVIIRWHFGSDGSRENLAGWYIDDVLIGEVNWVSEYDQIQYCDLDIGETSTVVFPTWIPEDLGFVEQVHIDYLFEAETDLMSDNHTENNYLAEEFSLRFRYIHDVGINEIISPYCGPSQIFNPEVVIENFGENNETDIDINMKIQKATYDLFMEEDFEGQFPPQGWTNNVITGDTWHRNDFYNRPNYAGGNGFCAVADSDNYGGPVECELILDLSGISVGKLSYISSYKYVEGGYADVDVSVDNGVSWINVLHWMEHHDFYGPGEYVEINLLPFRESSPLHIRFHFFAPGWDWYWEIDEINLYEVTMEREYNETVSVDIDINEVLHVTGFPDWIPNDLGVKRISYVDYCVATQIQNNDDFYVNNFLSKWITLEYDWIHDVGVNAILAPSGPLGLWPPGIFPVEANIKNMGDFYENDFSVNAKIWLAAYPPLYDELYYEEEVMFTQGISSSELVNVSFPDVSFNDSRWYYCRLDIRTELPGDEKPENDLKSKTFTIGTPDITPPDTTHNISGELGVDDWYVSPVLVELIAVDNQSGVLSTVYSVDNGTWMNYDEPFEVSEDGVHNISYFSIDVEGNVENVNGPFSFKIDCLPPSTELDLSGSLGDNNWYLSDVEVILLATDNASGVNVTKYKINDGNWQTYSSSFILQEEGQHSIVFYSVDRVGHEEQHHVNVVKIDNTNPTIELEVTKMSNSNWLLTAHVHDETSGVVKVEFYVDDSPVGVVISEPWEYEYQGSGEQAQAIAYDEAGNSAASEVVESNSQSHVENCIRHRFHHIFNVLKRILTRDGNNPLQKIFLQQIKRYISKILGLDLLEVCPKKITQDEIPLFASLEWSPKSHDFGEMQQGETETAIFEIWRGGACCAITYQLQCDCEWIHVFPTSGSSNGEHDPITVTINTTGLEYGLHEEDVSITSNGGSGNFHVIVTVIPDSPRLSYEPTEYHFGYQLEGETDSSTFELWNSGCDTLVYSLTAANSWINVMPTNGTSNGEHDIITVTINTTGLSLGTHTGEILLQSNEGEEAIFQTTVSIVEDLPELVISEITGGYGITAVVQNIGGVDAVGVDINITVGGGLFLTPQSAHRITSINAGTSAAVTLPVKGIGLGIASELPVITVTASAAFLDTVEKVVPAKILLFFVFIQ